MIKATENTKEGSMVWNNKFWILLGTYLIAFIIVSDTLPFPIGFLFIYIDKIDISFMGFMLGVISIIGVLIIQINYWKTDLKWIIFHISVVCTMYLSWLFLAIYGVNKSQSDVSFWDGFLIHLLFSLFFQVATLVIFCKLLEQIYLLRFKNVHPDVSKIEK